MNRKSNEELRIFDLFSKISGLRIKLRKKEDPPKPDILCKDERGKKFYFELSEIIDNDFARITFGNISITNDLNNYLKTKYNRYNEFSKKYSNAFIGYHLDTNMSSNNKTAIIKASFDYLMDQPDEFVGDLRLKQGFRRPFLSVFRGNNYNGPRIEVTNAVFVGEKTVSTLEKKLSKSYVANSPIHLLLYTKFNDGFPVDVWKPNLEDFISSNSIMNKFEKIWVFDVSGNQLKFTHPA